MRCYFHRVQIFFGASEIGEPFLYSQDGADSRREKSKRRTVSVSFIFALIRKDINLSPLYVAMREIANSPDLGGCQAWRKTALNSERLKYQRESSPLTFVRRRCNSHVLNKGIYWKPSFWKELDILNICKVSNDSHLQWNLWINSIKQYSS